MASGKRDYYDVLGIPRDAAPDAIKKAYRKLAIQLHPDRNKAADAEERFKELSEAYAVLSDPEKKQRYDQHGHAGIDQQYTSEDLYRTINFNDLFGGMGFESVFGNLFGFGGRHAGPSRGRDLQTSHAITLEEAFRGSEAKIEYWRLEACPHCKGTGAEPGTKVDTCPTCRGQGQVQRHVRTAFGTLAQVTACPDCRGEGRRIEMPCRHCKGSGHDRQRHSVTVTIPAGIESGQTLRVAGQGEVGGRGGDHGDLYVEVEVRPHERFHREGPDLVVEVPISFPEAVLGTQLKIATLDGEVAVDTPAGSETGQVLRVRGRGMPYLRGSGRGDLHVRLRVVVPDKVGEKARRLLEELAKELDVEGGKMGKRRKGLFG
ncbi:MAG: molecular chaperone DnaJ [Halobacteriales archaeon]|nr:molecular chaperone DnaJ [Halobacteriales archaeon]